MDGIRIEVRETLELLLEMIQARKDKKTVNCQERPEVTALEAEKDEIGAILISKYLN